MIHFLDQNGNKVEFTFTCGAFEEKAKHVLVICQYEGSWFLTRHKKRGLEFPGGKVEKGETLEAAARRETFEETGAIIGALQFIAEYKVIDPMGSFVKAVFLGNVERVEKTNNYFETNGPVSISGDILELRFGEEFSFIMKDQVIKECIHRIKCQNKKE